MASETQVRQYLAYWFQLGKPVLLNGGLESLLPHPVIQGDRYSQDFERCWQRISAAAADCHLQATNQTIAELLSPLWEIDPCSRCSMPVPVRSVGIASLDCPCIDVPGWPNTEVPMPRSPVSTQTALTRIRDRLQQSSVNSRSHRDSRPDEASLPIHPQQPNLNTTPNS